MINKHVNKFTDRRSATGTSCLPALHYFQRLETRVIINKQNTENKSASKGAKSGEEEEEKKERLSIPAKTHLHKSLGRELR